jgi:uncharacterized protein (DUF1778 family)
MERRILRLESRLRFLSEEFRQCVSVLDLTPEQSGKLADLMKSRLAEELSK